MELAIVWFKVNDQDHLPVLLLQLYCVLINKESDEALAKLAVQTENDWESRMARRVLMEKLDTPTLQKLTPQLVAMARDLGEYSAAKTTRFFWLSVLAATSGPVAITPNEGP